jgi:hypothetical protein
LNTPTPFIGQGRRRRVPRASLRHERRLHDHLLCFAATCSDIWPIS